MCVFSWRLVEKSQMECVVLKKMIDKIHYDAGVFEIILDENRAMVIFISE